MTFTEFSTWALQNSSFIAAFAAGVSFQLGSELFGVTIRIIRHIRLGHSQNASE